MVFYIDLWAIGAVALAYAARIRNTLAYTARVRNSPGSHITSQVLWTKATSSGPDIPTYRRSKPMLWLYNFVDRSLYFLLILSYLGDVSYRSYCVGSRSSHVFRRLGLGEYPKA